MERKLLAGRVFPGGLRNLRGRLEKPLFITLERSRDFPAHLRVGPPVAIDDFAQERFINTQALGEPILTDSRFPQL